MTPITWQKIYARADEILLSHLGVEMFDKLKRAVRPVASHPADSAVLGHIKD